ncbi:MAG: phosphatidylglycerol lysyltransferase domain-containing protein [Hespellia sp.]|nr:phosphatidylglycerol lysyltransferase domain-containing protein [Hespellia sp.]
MSEIEFKRPELEDKELITSYLEKDPQRSCEGTFVNIYLWSRQYHDKYAIIENTLVFQNEPESGIYSYPAGEPGDVKKAIDFLIEKEKKAGRTLKLVNIYENRAARLEEWYPEAFAVEYDRDYADYVYDREKLATLAGKKLHGKRNHINKFLALHGDNWSYESISEDNVEECFQMALRWRTENGCEEDEEKNAEMCVSLNALRLYQELGAVGGLLRVDGEIVAFSIGEPATEKDTFIVHIEKAFAEVEGAYPMINQQFIQHECEGYSYINREDDTGAEGLRKAKLSYRPVFLVEKGIAVYQK